MKRTTSAGCLGAMAALGFALVLSLSGCAEPGGDSTGPKSPDVRAVLMNAARAFHSVTTLGNGDLLIAGGTGVGGGSLASCDVFDASAAGTSSAVVACGAMSVARTRHTTTTLLSGNVVAIGGAASAVTEEFTPNAGTPSLGSWTSSGVAMLATPRSRHAAALLASGSVLVCGGEDATDTTIASCELYVSAGVAMLAASPMNVARRDCTATTLPDGRVLVAGGYDVAGLPLASAEVYDAGLDTWTLVGSMTDARALHGAVLLNATDIDPTNDRVLVTGGADTLGDGIRAAELFDPATNLFGPGGDLEGPGVFDHAVALLANGQAAVAGGFTSGGGLVPDDPVRETVVYAFGSGAGVGAQDLPGRRGGLRAGVIASAGPAGSDLVVVGGVDDSGTPRAEVWLLAIDDETQALADTLSDENALALGVFAAAFHVFTDEFTGPGDVELEIEEHSVFGRRVVGWVGNFYVRLEADAGSVTGDVEGLPFVFDVDGLLVVAPDMLVDFNPATRVGGDMDTAWQDFDFDVDRDATSFRGWIVGEDYEAELRFDTLGGATDPSTSFLDVYARW